MDNVHGWFEWGQFLVTILLAFVIPIARHALVTLRESLTERIDQVREAQTAYIQRVGEVEHALQRLQIDIAKNYVTKDELQKQHRDITDQLRMIERKIDLMNNDLARQWKEFFQRIHNCRQQCEGDCRHEQRE